MRRLFPVITIGAGILLLAQVITGQSLTGVPEILRATFADLPKLAKATTQREYRALKTWLPDRGLRGLYAKVRHKTGIAVLEELSGEKVFLKGPHPKGGLNLDANADFGRYNPAFVRWLAAHGVPGRRDPVLRQKLQPVYDQHLRRTARGFFTTHQSQQAQPGRMEKIQAQYLKLLKARRGAGYYLQESFRPDADRLKQAGHDWFEVTVSHGFWVRRTIDGTADEFHTALSLLLETYDPGFLKEQMQKRGGGR